MLSELRTHKFTALFACFDFDKNGILEKSDYEHFAQNLSTAYALTPGTAPYATMHAETMALWDFVHNMADKDGDHRVSSAEFIDAYGAMTDNDEIFQQMLMSYAEFVIRTGDIDGDGRLNEDEYTKILWCYGIADADARKAFQHLVTDGSSSLTNAAMEQVFAEFFRSDDPSAAGNWMIGPL